MDKNTAANLIVNLIVKNRVVSLSYRISKEARQIDQFAMTEGHCEALGRATKLLNEALALVETVVEETEG